MIQSEIDADMLAAMATMQAKDNARKDYSASKVARQITSKILAYPAFQAAMDDFLNRRGPGRHNQAGKILADTGLHPDVISKIAVQTLFELVHTMSRDGDMHRTSAAIRLSDGIHAEWRMKVFGDDAHRRTLLNIIMENMDAQGRHKEDRIRTMSPYFKALKLDWTGWNDGERVKVGLALLYMLQDTTQLIRINGSGRVEPTESLENLTKSLVAKQAHLFIRYMPMTERPRPWSDDTFFQGAYQDAAIPAYAMIKHTGQRDAGRVLANDWSGVYSAVNALQETGWRICRPMLDAVTWVYNVYSQRPGYEELGKLPRGVPVELPEVPPGYDTNPAIKKAQDLKYHMAQAHRRRSVGPRVKTELFLKTAEKFRNEPAIYFPHVLDSRGRAYSVPSYLSPMGPDHVRSVLEFSEGHRITDAEGERWLAICGANAFGHDKQPLDERVAWVEANHDMILSVAADYQSDRRWMQAAEPFQFLRFAFEWAGYNADKSNWLSRIPVALDASCSGIQHFAALLRSEDLGRSVNLMGGSVRQDIYGEVLATLLDKIDDHPWGQDWIDAGLDRSVVKVPVMSLPYALTRKGCRNLIADWAKDRTDAGHILPWPVETKEEKREHAHRITWLSDLLWSAMDARMGEAKTCMHWFATVAREFTRAANKTADLHVYDRRMRWLAPDGFEVFCFKPATVATTVNTVLFGKTRVQAEYRKKQNKLSVAKMAQAVSANMIHSLDACHLRMTIRKAAASGITSFSTVHDSFAVHAGLVRQFRDDCLRPEFIAMHSQDILGDFGRTFEQFCKVPPPAKGSLDLALIHQSDFCFA